MFLESDYSNSITANQMLVLGTLGSQRAAASLRGPTQMLPPARVSVGLSGHPLPPCSIHPDPVSHKRTSEWGRGGSQSERAHKHIPSGWRAGAQGYGKDGWPFQTDGLSSRACAVLPAAPSAGVDAMITCSQPAAGSGWRQRSEYQD